MELESTLYKCSAVFEKCDRKQDVPFAKEPILSVVKTNNYNKIYDSNVKKSKWYSTKKYCPFNQLGEYNDNPNNVKECTFYDVSNQGHDYLEGKQPAWKSIEYTIPKSLGLYHPKSKPKTLIEEEKPGEKNLIKNEYYKDDEGRYYYPLGSVWSGLVTNNEDGREDINEFSPKSKETSTGNIGDGPEKETLLVTGDVVDPVDYVKIWNSKGDGKGCLDCQEEEATIWRPIAPEGYMCIGDVVVKGNNKPAISYESLIKCVPEKCVAKIPLGKKVWDSNKLTKKVFAEDPTSGENAIHPIHKFYIKLAENFDDINYNDDNSFKVTKSDLIDIIDNLISEENEKKDLIRENSTLYKNPFNTEINIKKLNAFKKSTFIEKYPIQNSSDLNEMKKSKTDLYTLGNKINGVASKILASYYDKYNELKDVGFTEFNDYNLQLNKLNPTITTNKSKKLTFTNNETADLKPIISGSKPVNIYSAGASEGNMEGGYRNDLVIKGDGGHNLFLADNESSIQKPKFAYKLKKQCFLTNRGKPIETNVVAGTLSNISRKNENIKSAVKYFTFPMNILITSENGSLRSPTGKPKKYYLTLAKTFIDKDTNAKTPVYIIRTANKKDMTFNNCIGVYNDKLVSAAINVNYKGNFWLVENIDPDKKNFVPEKEDEQVIVRIKSYNDPNKLFSHEYSIYGIGNEQIKSITENENDNSCKWKSEKLRD